MFDDISTREIIIFAIVICLVLFAIYLFTETRSLRASLDSIDADADAESEDGEGEEGQKQVASKEEVPDVFRNGGLPTPRNA